MEQINDEIKEGKKQKEEAMAAFDAKQAEVQKNEEDEKQRLKEEAAAKWKQAAELASLNQKKLIWFDQKKEGISAKYKKDFLELMPDMAIVNATTQEEVVNILK